MTYYHSLLRSGSRLFRLRSYIPLALLVVLLFASSDYDYFGGTQRRNQLWQAGCLLVSLFGLGIRAHVVGHAPTGTSGRNTGGQLAESLTTTGLYSLVRNPLYLGNFFMWLGVTLFVHDLNVLVIMVLFFWWLYERIILAEEDYLLAKFGNRYALWAKRTPVFFPRLSGYVAPPLRFCFRSVLRREYPGFFAVIASMYLLNTAGNRALHGSYVWDPLWTGLLGFALFVYLVLRITKKRLDWLNVSGR